MAKGNSQKKAGGSALDFEAQLWAAAEQAVPAPNCDRWKRWPCASTSGGMFVSSEKFVEEHGGRVGDIRHSGRFDLILKLNSLSV